MGTDILTPFRTLLLMSSCEAVLACIRVKAKKMTRDEQI